MFDIIYYILLSIYLTCNICRNVFAYSNETTNCTALRQTFAVATSEFTSCAVFNSRPITLCESCVNFYITLLESYENLTKFSDNETLCINKFINLDRLQIVEVLFSNSINLWNTAKCYDCFHIVNGTISPNRSTEAVIFNQKYDKFMNCINRTHINDTTLCPTCMEDYVHLNNYYIHISNINENIGFCMDIVDMMNTTWSFWSTKCCKYRRHDEYYFIASIVTIFAITISFYILVQFCSEKRSPAILEQTRFHGSLTNIN